MTKILRNHIIHEFAGVCYENPDLYHERHDKRSRWEAAPEGGNTPATGAPPVAVPLGMGPFGAPPLLVPLLDMAIPEKEQNTHHRPAWQPNRDMFLYFLAKLGQ